MRGNAVVCFIRTPQDNFSASADAARDFAVRTIFFDLTQESLQRPAAAAALLVLTLWTAPGPRLVTQMHVHDVAAEGMDCRTP